MERELARRDAKERRRGRVPDALFAADSDDESSEDERAAARRRRQYERAARAASGPGEAPEEEEEEEPPLPVEIENFDPDSTLADFARRPEIRAEVERRFAAFLRAYVDEGSGDAQPVYRARIHDMCASNSQSLHVSYLHLSSAAPTLAIWVSDIPRIMLDVMDDVATAEVKQLYPQYDRIHSSVHVRITHVPVTDRLRDLRCKSVNELVKVSGVVTRRTAVLPRLKHLRYLCSSCRESVGPFAHSADRPTACPFCGHEGHMRIDSERTVYSNYQRVTLQESPGTVPAGRVPRQKELVLLDDLVDSARPGEEIEVTGVYVSTVDAGLNAQNGFPVFATLIEANFVQKREDLLSSLRVTDADKRRLRQMAAEPRVVDRIVGSVAPSIHGHARVKTAVCLAMFGGREKNVEGKHHVRGDINVLLLGDPGTAKSQCLKYVEKTAPRAVFTTGKGASAVGLTACVRKDAVTREWTLEGGALVLADRGVCLIDEFDKMNEKDRTSIHEAMEQQSISISKAGIVTTLQARCAVVAAANPIGGLYDPQRSFAENVELTDPILQRFDVLCVLQDTVNPEADARLAKFVVSSHVRSHLAARLAGAGARGGEGGGGGGGGGDDEDDDDENEDDFDEMRPVRNVFADQVQRAAPPGGFIDQETLRKYIIYARSLRPQLSETHVDVRKIESVYVQLRQESAKSGGVPIGVRHAESIIRMSEAFARMRLREFVSMDDVDRAIRVMVETFTQAQRFSARRALSRSLQRFVTFDRDNDDLLLYVLEELAAEHGRLRRVTDPDVVIPADELESRARDLAVDGFVPDFLESRAFREANFRVGRGKRGEAVVLRAVLVGAAFEGA